MVHFRLSSIPSKGFQPRCSFLSVWAKRAKDEIEEWSPHVYDVVYFFASEAVKYAEQAGVGNLGEEKLKMATEYLQDEMNSRGYPGIDVELFSLFYAHIII